MTVGEKLTKSAAQLQDAWTSVTDTWTQTVQDALDAAAVDPWALFRPDAAFDQLFEWARRTVEINRDLLQDLAGMSVTAEVSVGSEVVGREVVGREVDASDVAASKVTFMGAEAAAPPIDVAVVEVRPAEAPIELTVSGVEQAEAPVVGEVEAPEAGSAPSTQPATPAPAAGTYSRRSKAELQTALSDRHLPVTGTIKELRERLIEADHLTLG